MKKTIFIIVIALFAYKGSIAQDSTNLKNNNWSNEIGIDITGFIKQFVISTDQQYNYYTPIYLVNYRRLFKAGNIRSAIGGDYNNSDTKDINEEDKLKYKSYSIAALIGWEFEEKLSKRWKIFYGLDFRTFIFYEKDDVLYNEPEYTVAQERKNRSFGLAPLLGIKFQITNRLALFTETSFGFYFQNIEESRYFTTISNNTTYLPEDEKESTKRISGHFNQPLSLVISFKL